MKLAHKTSVAGRDPRTRRPSFTDVISQLSLLREISPPARRDLASRLIMRRRPAGALIIAQDEPSDSLYIVQSGRVKLALFGENGREMTLLHLGPGEIFGEIAAFGGGERGLSAIALADSTLLSLSRERLLEHLALHPATALPFLREMSRRMRRQTEIIGNLALRDVALRVARILVRLAHEKGRPHPDGLLLRRPPTQQELASMVGSCRETVSRSIKGLAGKGLLRAKGRALVLTPAFVEFSRAA